MEDDDDLGEISEYELERIKKGLDHKMYDNIKKDI